MLRFAKRLFIHTRNFFAVVAAFYLAMGISPAFQTFTGVSMRGVAIAAQGAYTAGLGLVLNSGVFSIDQAAVPTYIAFSQTVDPPNIPAADCSEFTFTVTGAQVGNSISPSWPPGLDSGITPTMLVSATDTVKVRLCKAGSAFNPGSMAWGGMIVRPF